LVFSQNHNSSATFWKLLALTFFGSAWDQGRHLFKKLHTSTLQSLKGQIGFPSAYKNLNHRGNAQSRQNDAKTISLCWVSQPKFEIFIKSKLFGNFFEAFGSEFFRFGMGPGEAPSWRAPSRDASIP